MKYGSLVIITPDKDIRNYRMVYNEVVKNWNIFLINEWMYKHPGRYYENDYYQHPSAESIFGKCSIEVTEHYIRVKECI